ncbi:wiskott-Aldrich syndrome protein homolog 1-like [Penaeus japonicus]|uniref:wiskott-Aldrich syndrome protein homolog 1-like n=1 Tax=Penaeus japonicus TaxID=27405 RepID=UPI001C70C2B8|nr:wiskott-Aldrich syndrome protein homolog 1-like [Penaeus japonicus]
MKRCVETAVILVMSAVLTATALMMMQPYGMAGVALAFTIAGVYIALMVLIVTVKCCSRDNARNADVERQASNPNDAPPPYDQVVTKPPSYRTLFFPSPPRLLAALATNPGLLAPPGDAKTAAAGLQTNIGSSYSASATNGLSTSLFPAPRTLPPGYSAGERPEVPSEGVTPASRDQVLSSEGDTTAPRTGEGGSSTPLPTEGEAGSSAVASASASAPPTSSPPSRPRTPRRVRFELGDADFDDGQGGPEPLPDEGDSSKS